MTKQSSLFGLIGFIAIIIGFLGKTYYRDYVNSTGINDYGIAGFLPSYFYVLGFSLLLLIKPTKFPKSVISIVTIASILFEIKQYISTDKFDLKDILASIAGGLTGILVLKLIDKKY